MRKINHSSVSNTLWENLKDNVVRFLLTIMKNPKICPHKGNERIHRLKVPMWFKGDDGETNEKLFKLHQIQEPSVEGSNKYTKIQNFIQTDQLFNQNFRGCEHWITCRVHLQITLSLTHELDITPIPSCHGLNDLRLPPDPESKEKIPTGKKVVFKVKDT